MRLSYRLVSGLLVLASIVGMSFALYLEHVKGLEPCPLCIFQRVGLMAMGFVALIAFLHNPVSNAIKRFYAFWQVLQFYGQWEWRADMFGYSIYHQIKYQAVVRV